MKNNLRVHRAIYNISQDELAKAVGSHRQTIFAIESGKYLPNSLLAMKIAYVLNKSVEEIFRLDDSEIEGLVRFKAESDFFALHKTGFD